MLLLLQGFAIKLWGLLSLFPGMPRCCVIHSPVLLFTSSATFMLCLLKVKRQEAMREAAGTQPLTQFSVRPPTAVCPVLVKCFGSPLLFLESPLFLEFLLLFLQSGWLYLLFFGGFFCFCFFIHLNEFHKTLWSLMNAVSQPPVKQAYSML